MKKTVNINLAGTLFHIDEDAFGKLTRYLDAIRASIKDPIGADEIIKDIEARIAELFSEKVASSAQVVSLKELDEVIAVMGQPEDYSVDEEIFEDEPTTEKSYRNSLSNAGHKQLFRDIDNKIVSGVSSGIGHYFGIDAIWVRLSWVLLVIAGFGSPILVYILFWIIVPAAETTSEKLKMTGVPINISNIEKKFKEGYENVADRVKNMDYDKYGRQIKQGTAGFFDTLATLFVTIFKVLGKVIGVFVILIAIGVLISLVVGFFTIGSIDIWGTGEIMDYVEIANVTNAPIWLVSILSMLAVGIPFFVLLILGLKLLVTNLKSIGRPAKIVLLLVWIASLIGLGILGMRLATERAYDGQFLVQNNLNVKTGDTLQIAMLADATYEREVYRDSEMNIKYDTNQQKQLYSNNIAVHIRSTNDSIGRIEIEKKAEGNSFLQAKKNAEDIKYEYVLKGDKLNLNGFFLTNPANKFREQEIDIFIYLPVGTIVYSEENAKSFIQGFSENDNSGYKQVGHYVRILQNESECLDCPADIINDNENTLEDEVNEEISDSLSTVDSNNASWEDEVNSKLKDNGQFQKTAKEEKNHIKLDGEGLEIKVQNSKDTVNIKIGG